MPVSFKVTITDPAMAVIGEIENLLKASRVPSATDYQMLRAEMHRNLCAACQLWANRIDRAKNAMVDVEVRICYARGENFNNGLASGKSKGAIDIGQSRYSHASKKVTTVMDGAVYEIVHGDKPSEPGILITVPPNNYLAEEIWFDPKPIARSDPPHGRMDAVTLFLHEMGHGLGINGRLVHDSEVPASEWGKPKNLWVSKYDEHVFYDRGEFVFRGPNAMRVNGGMPVPLSDKRQGFNNYHHVVMPKTLERTRVAGMR